MKLSVIVCAYQAEKHITRALDSLTAQTTKHFHTIVVNDGSLDETAKRIENHAIANARKFTFINKAQNEGLAKACNSALTAVDTPFFLRLDADDELRSDAIEEFLLKVSPLTTVYCDRTEVHDATGARREVDAEISKTDISKAVACGIVFETDRTLAIGGYRAVYWEEYDFWIRYLTFEDDLRFKHIRKPLYTYYKSPDSMTGNKERVVFGYEELKKLHGEKVLHDHGLTLERLLATYGF